ncbi:putative AlkP superfamily pyrophosphatase or phosphodiesterase [Bacillus mesophilus]|uniref:alkaline phosphatase family protein n=1 Tax=Bacillus mesophilus TaxID=1808955 RepID=UPI00196A1722|nr:alkaline phosphatase family protein [Bacillus mesophilus]MBM7662069.1 putative AlkP superfamily pyrophosphatase or phosphodiesterase [Bacillus mesophilus]
MKIIITILSCLFLVTISYFLLIQLSSKGYKQPQQLSKSSAKPVVVLLIDSIMDEPLQAAIEEGKAPAFQFLIENGQYYPYMVSSFPTMSVSIDSTFLTGTYPDQHKVPALVWYDNKEKELVSYGSAWKEIMKLGVKEVFTNSIFRLNHTHLSKNVSTIHEELDGHTASINTLVYRGNHEKSLNVPRLIALLGILDKSDTVKAPTYFSYGLLSFLDPENNHTHLWQAFGFNDKFATTELKYLIQNNRLPSFSLVYFPDNDKKVHKHGTNERKGIENADLQLQELLNMYGSWEDAIENNTWIVMGDSGQSDIGANKERALIDLPKLLNGFRIHDISEPIKDEDQIVLGLNERMSFGYILDDHINIEEVATLLTNDERIGFIAWKEEEKINAISTHHTGRFSFKPTGDFIDQYKQTWTIEGNERILDLILNNHQIIYREYPDGLARLYSSFYSHSGTFLVINAKPGFQFVGEGFPTHIGGGSHGSLNKEDSHFPMIVAGTTLEPRHERLIDLKEWILRIVEENRMQK